MKSGHFINDEDVIVNAANFIINHLLRQEEKTLMIVDDMVHSLNLNVRYPSSIHFLTLWCNSAHGSGKVAVSFSQERHTQNLKENQEWYVWLSCFCHPPSSYHFRKVIVYDELILLRESVKENVKTLTNRILRELINLTKHISNVFANNDQEISSSKIGARIFSRLQKFILTVLSPPKNLLSVMLLLPCSYPKS